MVTAASLGNVMEQTAEIQAFGLDELLDEFAGERKLAAEFRHGEAAQIAHDHERMRIDCVDVEQVMLHLADDAPEGRQVGAEHAVGIHAPQLVGDAARLAHDFHEQAAAGEILAKRVVDAVQVGANQPDRSGAHAFEFRVLLQDQEYFQHARKARARTPAGA